MNAGCVRTDDRLCLGDDCLIIAMVINFLKCMLLPDRTLGFSFWLAPFIIMCGGPADEALITLLFVLLFMPLEIMLLFICCWLAGEYVLIVECCGGYYSYFQIIVIFKI
jgi:hypothetical protein